MSSQLEPVFVRLRRILEKHAAHLSVADDSVDRYCLEGLIGPATLRSWAGKAKQPRIPVAWVQVGRAYVSYHVMGISGNSKLLEGMSRQLKARMQGKTCFNFKRIDESLLQELEQVTDRGIAVFEKAGYIAVRESA